MNDLEVPPSRPRASIKNNPEFMLIETYSGFRLGWADPEGQQIYLPPDASADSIGCALIAALSASRIFTVDNRPIITREQHAERYERWVENLMQRYGYRTRRAAFKSMKSVSADVYHGKLHIRPSRHEKLEAWGQSKSDGFEDVILPYPDGADAIGEAVRIALERCR
ncbi:contact-dependent growth inhibition system immunity protein [Sphingomonas sp. 22176]|uniref:contact-dependent growth inhibition system immunity protein n=1 Tax=Sphingomonas sp. 22176 TaxID=3453884 RepID=UPI003F841D19